MYVLADFFFFLFKNTYHILIHLKEDFIFLELVLFYFGNFSMSESNQFLIMIIVTNVLAVTRPALNS